MAVVAIELAVVEGLAVVRVGSRRQEQAGQSQGVAMVRLVALVLATPENAGEHSERVCAVPQVASVGVGPVLEQKQGHRHRVVAGSVGIDAGVGEIEQWLPVVGATQSTSQCRIVGQEGLSGTNLARGCGRRDVGPAQLRCCDQQRHGFGVASKVVPAVGETAQPQKAVNRIGVGTNRSYKERF